MHSSSIAPQMETSIESKFSAAFEQQNSKSSKSHLYNGNKKTSSSTPSSTITTTTNTESSGEKSVRFRKGNDLESFEALSSLYANGLFTDLVICCAGKMFKCHRVVMAAASVYMRDALSAFYNNEPESSSSCNNCNTVMILPKEIKVSDMEAILHFIYDGQIEVKVDCIDSFLLSARTLDIKGLSNLNIVFNNNGTASATEENVNESDVSIRKNNGYSKNHNSILTNGHTGMNSPPPSPPSHNSSLASLKALTGGQSSALSLQNGNHINSKLLNGGPSSHLINQYRHSIRGDSPLRNDQASILGHNITPAHQSSTPKSIFSNGSVFNSNARIDSSNSGGSRRKQKFPNNIPSIISEMLPSAAAAAAFYNSLLNFSEEDEEETDDVDEEKKLIIKDDSSNDCSTAGDNMSNASMDAVKQSLPFGVPMGSFNPQVPCMIEVEADPTTFPTYCHDLNDNTPLLQPVSKRRKQFKSPYPGDKVGQIQHKKLKMPYSGPNSNNSLDVSLKPSSPLMSNSSQSSPAELLSKKHSIHSSSIQAEKPLFSTYSAMKTAAGANPSASSPSSASLASSSNSWAGNKWKCDICNKYYGNKQTLKEHMDYFHSNREEQIYICNICNKEYTWRKSLMKHYRDIHQMRNTPALAEINRQLAALATGKSSRNTVSNIAPQSNSNDSALQSFVSIANFANQKSNPASSVKSSSSEKSVKSESEMDNENTNDVEAVAEDDDEDANDENEMDASSEVQEESVSLNGDSKCGSTSEKTKSNQELSDTSSNVGVDNSPASSHASS